MTHYRENVKSIEEESQGNKLFKLINENAMLKKRLRLAKEENREIRRQLEQQISELSFRLEQAHSSLDSIRNCRTWKINRWYMDNIYPTRLNLILEWFIDHVTPKFKRGFSGEYSPVVDDTAQQLQKLVEQINACRAPKLFLVVSAFPFDESYNQRVINLSKYISALGYHVVYVGWRWTETDQFEGLMEEVHPGVYQVASDHLFQYTDKFIQLKHEEKYFIIEFAHPGFFTSGQQLKLNGFKILYDIIDDWEEFHKVSQAPWFDQDYEEALVLNADAVTSVSIPLADKFSHLRSDIELVPNGFSREVLGLENANIAGAKKHQQKNHILIGYFGHLTPSWFDWKLVLDVAKENQDIRVEIIGYGETDEVRAEISQFDNIVFHGKIDPGRLHEYVRHWDVAIIPFKSGPLSHAVDPIKLYEYLFFGLPVVIQGITGISDLERYPFIKFCNNEEGFERAIRELAKLKENDAWVYQDIESLLNNCTWEKRFDHILRILGKNQI